MVEGCVILLILASTRKYTDGYIVGKLHNNLTRHETSQVSSGIVSWPYNMICFG